MKTLLLVLFVGTLLSGCGGEEEKASKQDFDDLADRVERLENHLDIVPVEPQRRKSSLDENRNRIAETRAKKTLTTAKFREYQIALANFQSANGGSFLGLFNSEDPVNLSDPDVRDKFLMALKGKKLVNDQWIDLEAQEARKYNPRRQQFYDFDEDQFDEDGNLVDTWGNTHIKIIVDWDGDGFIQLPNDSEVNELDGSRIQQDVVIYVLAKDHPDGEGQNVFSWVD